MTDLEKLIQNGKTEQNKLNPKIKDADKDKKLSPLTLKQYTTSINKLYRELNIQKEITNLLWLEQYKEDIKKYILSLNSPNTTKTYLFDRSDQSSVEKQIANRIKAPPIVGVPDLLK